ncbi:MAG: serpin family protein [Gemmatirosa sp.]
MSVRRTSRRTTLRAALAAGLSLALSACGGGTPVDADGGPGPSDGAPRLPPGSPAPAQLTAAESRTIDATNEFSLALFREVSRLRSRRTLFISPYSAAVALGMTLNGAAGTTADAMQRTLGVSGRTLADVNESHRLLAHRLAAADTGVRFVNANAIFYDRALTFAPAFFDTTRKYFDAQVEALDFTDANATLARVNGWASERTGGRIQRILEEVRAGDQAMFLVNALYFKGDWSSPFETASTRPAPFTRADGSTQTVHLMSRRSMYPYWRASDLEAAELPYGAGKFAMTVVLPGSGRTLDQLVASLTPDRWKQLTDSLRPRDLQLSLPRFTLTYEDEWKDVLTAMGMGIAFQGGVADFTRMSPQGRRLFIEFVKQKTFVGVNEKGTEAGAVTTVGVGIVSMPQELRVDRAFVFAIRERATGALLFVGKVAAIP